MSNTCRLIGINRLKYYRRINKEKLIQEKVEKVINLVNEIRVKMPRLGGKKLYHLLRIPLQGLKIGRDKFFDISSDTKLKIE